MSDILTPLPIDLFLHQRCPAPNQATPAAVQLDIGRIEALGLEPTRRCVTAMQA